MASEAVKMIASSKVHRLKKLLKPLVKLVQKRSPKAVPATAAAEVWCDDADDQNALNEALENRIREAWLSRRPSGVVLEGDHSPIPPIPVRWWDADRDLYDADAASCLQMPEQQQVPAACQHCCC